MLEMLTFIFFVEVGWVPEQEIWVPESQYIAEDIFYVDMDAYFQWSVLWMRTGMKLYGWPMKELSAFSFFPARIDFRGAFGITYNIFTVGIRHSCSRSIAPYGRVTDPVDGYYNEVFLRLEAKIGE